MCKAADQLFRRGFPFASRQRFHRCGEGRIRRRRQRGRPVRDQLRFGRARLDTDAAGVALHVGRLGEQQRLRHVGAVDEIRERQPERLNLRGGRALFRKVQPCRRRDARRSVATAAFRGLEHGEHLRLEEHRVGCAALRPRARRGHHRRQQHEGERQARNTKRHRYSSTTGFSAVSGVPRGAGRFAQETNVSGCCFRNSATASGVTSVSVR